jgi:ferrous iron transport protein A
MTTLADIPPDETVELVDVPDDARARLLRLGFLDGCVECRRQIPDGPVIVRRRGSELALGRTLARNVAVERTDAVETTP